MAESTGFILLSHYTGFVVVSGLAAWLGGVCANRIARKENQQIQEQLAAIKSQLQKSTELLKAELQTDLNIHRIQFEKEFQIYTELAHKMSNVRRALFTLQPNVMPVFDDPRKEEEHWEPLRKNFVTAWEALRNTLQDNRPFYHESVFAAGDRVIDISMGEVIRIRMPISEERPAFEEIHKMKGNLLKALTEAENAIKERITTVRVRTQ